MDLFELVLRHYKDAGKCRAFIPISRTVSRRIYSLGVSPDEQQRLHRQRELYGDTADLKFGATDTVCEIGAGAGANLWIARQLPRGRYIGVDVESGQNEAAARYARELGLTNVEFHTANADDTGLPSDAVDASFCRCVLVHQPDPQPLLQEMCRITRAGGRIVVIEPHDTSYYCGPDKPHLMKCFRARGQYAYGEGRGSRDVALNLYPLLRRRGLRDIGVTPHVITVYGHETGRCRDFLQNWLQIIARVSDKLLELGAISERDLQLAAQEAGDIKPETVVHQIMWIAQAIK
ncbi:MAG: methyltransferase domain-containing protein [Nitrospira sp.]|nr:methyltransferase domain-containing protein [Nitrospira sp.]